MTSFATAMDLMCVEEDMLPQSIRADVLPCHEAATAVMREYLEIKSNQVALAQAVSAESDDKFVVVKCGVDRTTGEQRVVRFKAASSQQADIIAYKASYCIQYKLNQIPVIPPAPGDSFYLNSFSILNAFHQHHETRHGWKYLLTRPLFNKLATQGPSNVDRVCAPLDASFQKRFRSIEALASHLRSNELAWVFESKLATQEDLDKDGIRDYSLMDALEALQCSKRFTTNIGQKLIGEVLSIIPQEQRDMRFKSGNRALRFLTLHYPHLFQRTEPPKKVE